MAIYSRSPIQNFDNWWFWIRKNKHNIDRIYLYAKDLSKAKYEFLIKKREDVEIKYCTDQNAFIECLDTMDENQQQQRITKCSN